MSKITDEHRRKVYETAKIFTRMDSGTIPGGADELRLFVIARNESLRLPYFLRYYFNLGVDRVFLIDNNSSDNTVDIALSFENTHVFKIDRSFKEFWYWVEYFLEEYGKDRWCVMVDVDELLIYPYIENLGIKDLVKYFDLRGFTAMECLLLDIYSDQPIKDTAYHPDENPLHVCEYFDLNYFRHKSAFVDKKHDVKFERYVSVGGVRQRVFGVTKNEPWTFCLSKVPIFKYSEDTYLAEGMHAIRGASISNIFGIVFHTKFMCDFIDKAKEESERQVTWQDGAEYKIYNYHLSLRPDLALKDNNSVKYKNTSQLLEYRLMFTSGDFSDYVKKFLLSGGV